LNDRQAIDPFPVLERGGENAADPRLAGGGALEVVCLSISVLGA
jgi:hypothetical protein